MLFFLLRGNLPWTHVSNRDWGTVRAATAQIHEIKRSITGAKMASGHPAEFGRFLDDVRALSFDASPDYDGYRRRFRALYEEQHRGSSKHRVLDWAPLPSPDDKVGVLARGK
jgi:casein kinase 1